jgi:hypothetical protein
MLPILWKQSLFMLEIIKNPLHKHIPNSAEGRRWKLWFPVEPD